LFAAIASLLQKVLMKDDKSDPHAYSIAFQLLGSAIVATFALSHGFVMPPISAYPINFLLLAVLYGCGTLCLFNAYKHLEASEVTIVTSVRAVVTIVSAVVILGEVFSLQKGLGTVLILASVFIISERVGKIKLNKGMLYAFGMAVFFGLAITNDTYLLKHVDLYSYVTIGFLLPGLFLAVVKPKKLLELKPFLKARTFGKMFVFTSFYAASALCFYQAINNGANASQATPVLQSTVIVTVILAAIFLKERDKILKKILCAILVTIGVVLLS